MPGLKIFLNEEEFRKDWALAMSSTDMADKYGCSRATLKRFANQLGLSRKQRQSPTTIGLSGGAWVPDERGVMRWVAEDD